MGQGKFHSSGDAAIRTWLSRRHITLKKLGQRWGCVVNADVFADVEQEARWALWKAQPRWEKLPAEAQEAYAAQCARRAALRALRRELQHQRRMLFVEDLSAHDQNALASLPEASEKAELPSPQDFLASLENPLLAEAFSALSSEDQEVVFLAVVLEFSDSEIADELHITPAAATKHRQRALGRMRKFIEKLGGVFKGIVVLVREKILVRDVQFWRGGCLIYK